MIDGDRWVFIDWDGVEDAERREFPQAIAAHTRGMFELLVRGAETGEQPWARLHAEGHADYWGPAAEYVEQHHDAWLKAVQ
ncbi:hypothetical protein [Kribbella sp. NPDC051770]|uniref:hypothetical protein n=1 Tax=Kribbella sp. NPDC051770 TaxID=3155413 RepID=UPI00342906CD